jgi:AcrR family transcriptional regulator
MRSIAAEANMTTGSIYYCYKNKQELFEDIISDSIHFTHRIFQEYELEKKPQYDLLSDVEKEARLRLKHKQEEKLYIMLLANALNKDSGYRMNYMKSLQTVTAQAGELFSHIYGIDNSTLPEQFASIFMATLDGVAIQQLYNALPTDESDYTDTLIDFFKECVPLYISKHSGDN